jgi:YfdX protein
VWVRREILGESRSRGFPKPPNDSFVCVDTSKDLGKAPLTARTLSVQVQVGIEKQRAEVRQEADKILDREAIAVIEETQRAIDAISANTTSEALAALERASGKIDILLARNPSTTLIPVSHEVVVFDTAPAGHQDHRRNWRSSRRGDRVGRLSGGAGTPLRIDERTSSPNLRATKRESC